MRRRERTGFPLPVFSTGESLGGNRSFRKGTSRSVYTNTLTGGKTCRRVGFNGRRERTTTTPNSHVQDLPQSSSSLLNGHPTTPPKALAFVRTGLNLRSGSFREVVMGRGARGSGEGMERWRNTRRARSGA